MRAVNIWSLHLEFVSELSKEYGEKVEIMRMFILSVDKTKKK